MECEDRAAAFPLEFMPDVVDGRDYAAACGGSGQQQAQATQWEETAAHQ
jgi:hypothetical protein